MKNRFFILFVLFSMLSVSVSARPKKLKWKKFQTETELKQAIFSELHENPTIKDVTDYFECQKAYYSVHENIIYVSSKAWAVSFWISKCWLLEFHYDTEGHLVKFQAKTALTGP